MYDANGPILNDDVLVGAVDGWHHLFDDYVQYYRYYCMLCPLRKISSFVVVVCGSQSLFNPQ